MPEPEKDDDVDELTRSRRTGNARCCPECAGVDGCEPGCAEEARRRVQAGAGGGEER